MELKVGDKVRVLDKKGLKGDSAVDWVSSKLKCVGFETYITYAHPQSDYFQLNMCDTSNVYFYKDWLEPVDN